MDSKARLTLLQYKIAARVQKISVIARFTFLEVFSS